MSNNTRNWFNDRRFTFTGSQGLSNSLRSNVNQLMSELQQYSLQHPDLMSRISLQINRLNELVNVPQSPDGAASTSNAVTQNLDGGQSSSTQNVVSGSSSSQSEVVLDIEFPGTDELLPAPTPSANSALPQVQVHNTDGVATVNAPDAPTDTATLQEDLRRLTEMTRNPEVQQIIKAALYILPFVVLFLLKNLVEHSAGLIFSLLMTALFFHLNHIVVGQVAAKANSARIALCYIIWMTIACSVSFLWLFDNDKLYYCFAFITPIAFQPGHFDGVCTLLWVVFSIDTLVRLYCVALKSCIALLPVWLIAFKNRGSFYRLVEIMGIIYRYVLPIVPWINYLFISRTGYYVIRIMTYLLILVYLLFKGKNAPSLMKECWTAMKSALFMHGYGTRMNGWDLKHAGAQQCPICFCDYKDAVQLSCKHIFCDDCISTWFDREKTCPVCRHEVCLENTSYKDGSTSIIPQLF